jgi:hypothetical protein
MLCWRRPSASAWGSGCALPDVTASIKSVPLGKVYGCRRKGQCVHLFAFLDCQWRGSLRRPRRPTAAASPGSSRTPDLTELVRGTYYVSGRRTASGQAFDPDGYAAAHRTLPFGSRVTITNPENGKSVTVVINDRGPFARGVTLDLTRGAARAIGMNRTQWVCML